MIYMSPNNTVIIGVKAFMASSCISFIYVIIILRSLLSNFKLNSHAYMLKNL